MYHHHYDYVLRTFNDTKLLFTDTDSLVYEIKGDNVYEQCFKDKHFMALAPICIYRPRPSICIYRPLALNSYLLALAN